MITYFKYTNGYDFTYQSGIPYKGFITVDNEIAYTGKILGLDSEQLVPTNTFLSEFYLKKWEFDNQFESIDDITESYSNVFDIFNKQELTRLVTTVNDNNLKIFKSTILPDITTFETDLVFYGLSSTDVDMRNDDTLTSKTQKVQIDPFSHDSDWYFLDDVKYSVILGDVDDGFTYIFSSGDTLGTVTGKFSGSSTLILNNFTSLSGDEKINGLHYDDNDKEVLVQYNSEVYVYDSSSWKNCLVELKSNVISLYGVFQNNNKVKFGNNYKITIIDNTLYIEDKFSTLNASQIDLSKFNCSSVLDFDIRTVDDYISILFKDDTATKLLFVDPEDQINITIFTIEDFDHVDISRVIFTKFDSNVIYTSTGRVIQYRAITNPKYPLSKTNDIDFKYIDDFRFSDTYQTWGRSIIKWNSNRLKSNFFNNLTFTSNSDEEYTYRMFHNIGRLYPIKSQNLNNYKSLIDTRLVKSFVGISCGETSVGIYLNNTITNLLRDTLNIYNQTIGLFKYDENDTTVVDIENFEIVSEDLFLNMNESINIVSIQRILSKIIEIQRKVIVN